MLKGKSPKAWSLALKDISPILDLRPNTVRRVVVLLIRSMEKVLALYIMTT